MVSVAVLELPVAQELQDEVEEIRANFHHIWLVDCSWKEEIGG
jgi:hypothetical protein